MKSLWILGHGRCFVDSQFVLDYSRVTIFFDHAPMPSDVREGVRLLYEKLDENYYIYTKFMNQTIGNYAYKQVKNVTVAPHLVVTMPTLRVHALSTSKKVHVIFLCCGYDINLNKKSTYHVSAYVNLRNYTTTVKCRVYKGNQPSYSNVQDTVQKYI